MIKYLFDGKEVTETEYGEEFEKQNLLFGTCINRSSLLQDGSFIFELIDYKKVWKQIGGPEPI